MKISYLIDAHAHTGYWPNLNDCEKCLVNSDKKHNINFCIFSFDGSEFIGESEKRNRLVTQIIGFTKAYDFQIKNSKNFGMLCWIRPHTENNYKEVENFIASHRDSIYGLKFHPWASQMKVNDPKLIPYFRIAEKFGLPICVHTAVDKYSKICYLEEVAKAWPHLTFVAAHAVLMSNHKTAIKAMLDCPNIFVDTAWLNMEDLKMFKEKGLLDRVLFGTDNPIDGEGTLDKDIYQDYFNNKINLNDEEYANVMYKNAMRVYNIKEDVLKSKK
jgi:predicted TIM-barrel fold metal-dependent hydrolase